MVCSATWSASTPEALVTSDVRRRSTDGTRQWSMPAADDWIHRSRPWRTTPSQSTGTLAWPQKMSAAKISCGDALLAGIDDLGLRRRGGDLRRGGSGFDRIAEDDSHRYKDKG